jgi:hypothetical protein
MPNPKKIIKVIKAVKPKKQADKAVGSAATKGRTGTNINAKGKKVSEGTAKGARPSIRPEDKLKPGMKAMTDELGFAVSKQKITKGVAPNLGVKKIPFVRSNAEANAKLKEINKNLSTLRNIWKRTPPSKRPNIVNSANRLQKQKDDLIKQLKQGKK